MDPAGLDGVPNAASRLRHIKETEPVPTQHAPWSGLWLPLVTPFSDGALDAASLRRLVAHYTSSH